MKRSIHTIDTTYKIFRLYHGMGGREGSIKLGANTRQSNFECPLGSRGRLHIKMIVSSTEADRTAASFQTRCFLTFDDSTSCNSFVGSGFPGILSPESSQAVMDLNPWCLLHLLSPVANSRVCRGQFGEAPSRHRTLLGRLIITCLLEVFGVSLT
jgi:hypothetical protein